MHVLKGVSLDVARGEATGIVGPSGSGKSTLLMVLAGLERVDSGTVRIAGELLNGKSEDQIAAFRGRNIGIVFQSFHLIPNMTALENVAVPLELAGHRRSVRRGGARARGGRPERPRHPLSRRAVGRRAAARGDRPGAGARRRAS